MSDLSKRGPLARSKKDVKISGVCAGIAEYFNIEVWLVRLVAASFLIFSGTLAVIVYFVAYFIMDEKKADDKAAHTVEIKTKVWQGGQPPQRAFHEIAKEFNELEQSLQRLEGYVTSNAYKIDRELKQL